MKPSVFRLVVAALVLAAVIRGCGVLVVLGRALPSGTSESGRLQLEAMQDDPVVAFRAPGTTLRSKKDHAASIDVFQPETSSSIRRVFEMTGEPGDAVAAYRGAVALLGHSPRQVV